MLNVGHELPDFSKMSVIRPKSFVVKEKTLEEDDAPKVKRKGT